MKFNEEILDNICDFLNSRSQDKTIDVDDLKDFDKSLIEIKINDFCIRNSISKKDRIKALEMIKEDRELSPLDGEPEYENEFAIGDICLDYNDTEVKILNIGTYSEIIKNLTKKQLDEVGEFSVDDLKKSDKVYLVKVNKSNDHVPIKKGVYGIYPVNYDFSKYWGLESKVEESAVMSFTQFVNESKVKKVNVDEKYREAIYKIDKWMYEDAREDFYEIIDSKDSKEEKIDEMEDFLDNNIQDEVRLCSYIKSKKYNTKELAEAIINYYKED